MKVESTRKANRTIEKRLEDEFNYSEDQLNQIKQKAQSECNFRDRFLIHKGLLIKTQRLNDTQKVLYLDAVVEFLTNGSEIEIDDKVVEFLFQDFLEDYQKSTDEYFPRAHNTLLRAELSRAGGKSGRPSKKSYDFHQAQDFHQKHYSKLKFSQVFKKEEDGDRWFLIDEQDRKFLKVS